MERNEVLLIAFMGQSNMAGRGSAMKAPALIQGAGYEYRAVTAPDYLSPLQEPFGENENHENGVTEPGMKTGSMVTAFVNACYTKTGEYTNAGIFTIVDEADGKGASRWGLLKSYQEKRNGWISPDHASRI